MKPSLQDINPLILNHPLYIKEIRTDDLGDYIHFHNGYEITLMLRGVGRRVIGDSIELFDNNDLVFIGPFLPHVTYCSKDSSLTMDTPNISALVVYFYPNWFTKNIFDSDDFIKINELLTKMSRGVKILGETKEKVVRDIIALKRCNGLGKAIKLWDILNLIAESGEYQCLASEGYSISLNKREADRLEEVYKYIMSNYSNSIKLEEVSSFANMTPTAFCKYFKDKTGRTLTSFINEVRIGQARKFLSISNLSISEVCYSCGFNNLTSFNRNFRRYTKKKPSEYRIEIKQ